MASTIIELFLCLTSLKNWCLHASVSAHEYVRYLCIRIRTFVGIVHICEKRPKHLRCYFIVKKIIKNMYTSFLQYGSIHISERSEPGIILNVSHFNLLVLKYIRICIMLSHVSDDQMFQVVDFQRMSSKWCHTTHYVVSMHIHSSN